ncbi:MAG: glycosyltransferase [Bacteroidales bacterium]|nr:glycosyltransferase [Bacteroidales bacterium]
MLSVLIPVYNFDIRKLVIDLHHQSEAEDLNYEIIIFDDASENQFKDLNQELCELSNVVYKEEPINLGRSKIRNKLASTAKYDHLLFLDCDSELKSKSFISNYVPFLKKKQVVYGGRSYRQTPPDERCSLHWMHGVFREVQPAEKRKVVPNKSFMTNNFLIHRDILESIWFDEENIDGYGHEDTLFGYELKKRNITINHVDNPVVHIGLEPSEEFLRKTRESIVNLKKIMRINGNEKRLVNDITLLSYYKKIEKAGLNNMVLYFYKRYEHVLRKNLMSDHPKLFLFDLYKLGYLCSLS